MTWLPATMRAAVYRGPGSVELEERAVPRPGPKQVLVQVSHCGVCGSDLHLMVEGWGTPGLVGGHEFTGKIAALGEEVSGWSVGEEVVAGPSPKCGRCRRCLEGKPSQCEQRGQTVDQHFDNGAFADYVLVNSASLLRIPKGLTLRQAALAEPLAVALHGISRSRLEPGDSAMVFGAGPIGALSVAALLAKGMSPVTVVEPGEARRRLVLDLGAHSAIDPSELESFPPWEPERMTARAVDAVLECSGKKAAMELGLHQLCRGGRLVLVGAGMEAPKFDPNRVILNELEVCGSFVYDADGFEVALDMLASGAVAADSLIERDDVPLDRLSGALADLAGGRVAGKVMIVPGLSLRSSKDESEEV